MGLFFNKKKTKCPICGNEISLLSGEVIADGTICDDCVKMIRGQFDIEEYWKRRWGTDGWHAGDYTSKTFDPLTKMSVADIQDMISEKKADLAKTMEDVGAAYSHVAKIEKCFSIAPKPFEVGLKRSKELKNKIVCTSIVAAGDFKRGDEVTVTTQAGLVKTKILDVIPCSDSSTFETELQANSGKHVISAGGSAWIIVDMTSGISVGDLVQK